VSKHIVFLLIAASITSLAWADSDIRILNAMPIFRKGLSGIAAGSTTLNMSATR